MNSIQAFFYISSAAVYVLAWLGGGRTERTGVILYLLANAAALLTQGLWFGDLRWAVALIDLIVLICLVSLALKRDRWWLLVASAFQVLAMLIYVATVAMPDLSARSGVAASWAVSFIVVYCLLGGVLERVLAGEARPVRPRSGPAVDPRPPGPGR